MKKLSMDIFIKNNLKKNPVKKKQKEILIKRLEGTITVKQLDLYDIEEINALTDATNENKTVLENVKEATMIIKYGLVDPIIDDKLIKALKVNTFEDALKVMFTNEEILGISREIIEFSDLTGNVESVGL